MQVGHPGLSDLLNPSMFEGGCNGRGQLAVRVWFHHYLQANSFRSFSKFVCVWENRCPAPLIVECFSHELGTASFLLAPVKQAGVRGRHYVLTAKGAFDGAVVLVQQLSPVKKLGTVLFRRGRDSCDASNFFDRVQLGHVCASGIDCWIEQLHHRWYYGQTVPIHHGDFFKVFIDEVRTPEHSNGTSSTCDSILTGPL